MRNKPRTFVIFVAITLSSVYNSLKPNFGVLRNFAASSMTRPAYTVIFLFKVQIGMSASPQKQAKDPSLIKLLLH